MSNVYVTQTPLLLAISLAAPLFILTICWNQNHGTTPTKKPPENILPKRSYKGGLLPKEVLPEELSDAEEASDTSDDPVEEPKE